MSILSAYHLIYVGWLLHYWGVVGMSHVFDRLSRLSNDIRLVVVLPN